MMHQLIYVSQISSKTNLDDIKNILEVARVKNAEHNVTGVLVFIKNVFVQVLEGDKKEIFQLLENIKKDPRNSDLVLLSEEPITERVFPDWTMGYIDNLSYRMTKLIGFDGVRSLTETIEYLNDEKEWVGDFLKECLKQYR